MPKRNRFPRRAPAVLAALALTGVAALGACSSSDSADTSKSSGDSKESSESALASYGVEEGPASVAEFYGAALPDDAKRGDVIWAKPRADAPKGSRAYTMLYVSQSVHGGLTPVSGSLYVPDGDLEPGLVLWAHETTGTGDDCAPSRSPIDKRFEAESVKELLKDDRAVVMTDYEGLGTPGKTVYMNGEAQARNSLDAARAAHNVLGDKVNGEFVTYGWSQGGQSALWTAHIAADYAPDLKPLGALGVGAAAKYHDLAQYELTAPNPAEDWGQGGYLVSALAGISVGKDLPLKDVLTPTGLELLHSLGGECFEPWAEAAKKSGPFAKAEALKPGHPWGDALAANDAYLPIPKSVPITLAHGEKDTDVPVDVAHRMRDELCERGSIVDYREYAGEPHSAPSSNKYIRQWVTDRFADKDPINTCS